MSIVAASESIFARLESTLETLARGGELSESMRDHSLGGAYSRRGISRLSRVSY